MEGIGSGDVSRCLFAFPHLDAYFLGGGGAILSLSTVNLI
jgi:hypothetical protein